jgi:hypothetical protein
LIEFLFVDLGVLGELGSINSERGINSKSKDRRFSELWFLIEIYLEELIQSQSTRMAQRQIESK